MRSVSIAGREIGHHKPPYVVAEISCNHSGSFDKACALIRAAADAGADAVKFQTYTPAELTTPDHKELWDLYEQAQTPREWHAKLFECAEDCNVTPFSSAFSVDGVKFLYDLGVPAIKIASAEATDEKLVDAAIDTGLPVIVSMGMLSDEDFRIMRWPDVIYLHCIARYPSRIEDANLQVIKDNWHCLIGLSDHTPGYETAIAATALGAVMIEKHFKIDEDCIDAAYSLDPVEFAAMAKAVRAIWVGMGDGILRPTGQPRQR